MPDQGSETSPPDTSINTGPTDPQAVPGSPQHIRALAMPFLKGQMVTESDGSLLIRDVPMLAEGNWTDSYQRTPLIYPAKTLESDAGNWLDTSGWSRHLGGVPRDSTDKVAEAVNPHFGQFTGKDGQVHNAVLSDVRVHPHTQKSRDMQEMIRHGLISFVSVEHGGDERLNPATRQMEAASLVFTGFAFVNKGACKLCRLNEEPQPSASQETPVPDKALEEVEKMDTKELEAQVAALTKELAEVKAAKPAEVKVEIPKELAETMAAMQARIKELENKPAAPVTVTQVQTKELGEVETVVVIDKSNRTITGA